jgi:hypothetical protein
LPAVTRWRVLFLLATTELAGRDPTSFREKQIAV